MNIEIWKDVKGYEGDYEVSTHGNVRTNINKTTKNSKGIVRRWEQRILKEKNKNGRDVRVDLWKDGKPKSYLVHRLVAYAFIPEIEDKIYINHIDGNPRNNHISNLEWCNHAFDNDLTTTNKKVKIINLETKEEFLFRSISKASLFLGLKDRSLHSKFTYQKCNELNYRNYLIVKI